MCSLGKYENLTHCGQRHLNNTDNVKCPSGYKCMGMLEMSPLCCNITNYEIYKRNVKPKCDNGKKSLKYLGKSCEDEFCPFETNCVQLEMLAHCCPK
uniref:EB domain-containing protein n=1 Tax=Meloidogyne hapla TaxID=6305 RepID=A0A1I8B3I3_MELHA